MLIKLKPKQGFGKIATQLRVEIIYALGTNTGTIYYVLMSDNNTNIIDGNLTVPEQVIAEWGDDMIIVNHALQALGLELEPEQETEQ